MASSGNLDEKLTNAAIAGGIAYGIPKAMGRAATQFGPATLPDVTMAMTDYSPHERLRGRGFIAENIPGGRELLQATGAFTPEDEAFYQQSQVPPQNPRFAEDRARPSSEVQRILRYGDQLPGMVHGYKDGGRVINEALSLAGRVRRANGGRISGPVMHSGGGRTDDVPTNVPRGSYVIPADTISALGQGNTLAGMKVLDEMFPKANPSQYANGGGVDIIVAGGEYVLTPDQVAAIGGGELEKGADILDEFVKDIRRQHVETLAALPGPVND
jgi:hypothetical protein